MDEPRARSRRVVALTYVCVTAALSAAALIDGSDRSILVLAAGAASVGAVALSWFMYRPAAPAAWAVLGAALTAQLVGASLLAGEGGKIGRFSQFPALSDYWLGAALYGFIVALGLFARRTNGAQHFWLMFLDSLIATLGGGLLVWILVFPDVARPWPTWPAKAISATYALGFLGVMAGALLVIRADVRAARAGALFMAGAMGLLASGLYGLEYRLHPDWRLSAYAFIGFALAAATWSAAVFDPGLRRTHALAPRPTISVQKWTRVLAVTSLVVPIVLLVQALRITVRIGPGLITLVVVLMMLLSSRFMLALEEGRRSVLREHILRTAGTRMIDTVTIDDVAARAGEAAAELSGNHPAPRLVIGGAGSFDESGDAAAEPGDGARDRGEPSSSPARLEGRTAARFERPEGPSLAPAVAASLDILADQATSALERLALQREVGRRDSELYFRTLVQNMSDVILIVDIDGVIRYASPSAARTLGDAARPGESLPALVAAEQDAAALRELFEGFDTHPLSAVPSIGARFRDGRGGVVDGQVRCYDLRDEPTVGGLVVTIRDVTEQIRLNAQLARLAERDPLTGLANRRRLESDLEQALAALRGTRQMVGVLMLDLDDFKRVNDTWGHAAGDELIRLVARRLRKAVRKQDAVARFGGDEFTLVVTSRARQGDLEALCDRIIRVLREPFTLASGPQIVSASLGLAVTRDADAVAGELLRQADAALYAAKAAGKGGWRLPPAGH